MPQDRSREHPPFRLACLIVGRNLGDAVIQSKFMRRLTERGYAERYVVWTRPEVDFLYTALSDCEVVTSPFPVGTNKRFDLKGSVSFCKALARLRQLKPSVTVDMIGDFRERIFARLVGRQPHHYIGWHPAHPFSRIIRNPFGASAPICTIPPSMPNLYAAYETFTNALHPPEDWARAKSVEVHAAATLTERKRVGLHPFASQDCKIWPDANWRQLAAWLSALGLSLTVYGAPSERAALLRIFGQMPVQPRYFTRSIRELDKDVADLDLMIGLDSFSVHMAERNGIKSIMLNACNHPTLWVPPRCVSIAASGGCPSYPCMNVPDCKPGPAHYACIRAVEPQGVFDLARRVLAP